MKKVRGFWFPDNDRKCNPAIFNEVEKIDKLLKLSKYLNIPLNICIQAGANVGVFPITLSNYYREVYTFEPQEDNYLCLVKNISEHIVNNKLYVYNFALSDTEEEVGIQLDKQERNNYGAFQIDESGKGIKTLLIDNLNLTDCNLIYLDIEGYEYKALKGAEKTILKYKPIIIIENKPLNGSEVVYGKHISETVQLVKSFGYSEYDRWMRDTVLIP